MNVNEYILLLANEIVKNGIRKEFEGGLVPSEFVENPTEYNKISGILYKKYRYTHYDWDWIEPFKIIKLRFGRGNAFGACRNIRLAAEYKINMFDKTVELLQELEKNTINHYSL